MSKPWKVIDNIKELQPGDMILSVASGITYIVTANYGNRVTAVRTVDVTNLQEWVVRRN